MVRFGHAVQPDTGVFAAYPSWSPNGDSLAFIPYRLRDIMEGKSATLLSSRRDAVHRQRLLFREIATTWRAALPQSADAMLALALALDAVGDPTALDSVRIARRLAVDGRQRFRAAAAEVWLRTKLSVPSNIGELDSARALADSLVRFYAAPASDMNALASLAELVGRVHDAARFARRFPEREDDAVPLAVAAEAQALLAFAAVGGPIDSLRAIERSLTSSIRASVPSAQQEGARARWLGRAVTLAFPSYRSEALRNRSVGSDPLTVAEAAALAHDSSSIRRNLQLLRAGRRSALPEDLKPEAAYPEASLLALIGDTRDAIDWLDPVLEAQSRTSPEVLSEPAGAGSLVMAMVLRAELADRVGDRAGAARWAKAVTTLWRNADPFLQPVVQRLATIVEKGR
jgi:hypothetical protein